jgi:hypothetical protein
MVNGRYECAQCGAVLDIDAANVPCVVFHAASGQPNMRVVKVNGRELHRCEVHYPQPEYRRH